MPKQNQFTSITTEHTATYRLLWEQICQSCLLACSSLIVPMVCKPFLCTRLLEVYAGLDLVFLIQVSLDFTDLYWPRSCFKLSESFLESLWRISGKTLFLYYFHWHSPLEHTYLFSFTWFLLLLEIETSSCHQRTSRRWDSCPIWCSHVKWRRSSGVQTFFFSGISLNCSTQLKAKNHRTCTTLMRDLWNLANKKWKNQHTKTSCSFLLFTSVLSYWVVKANGKKIDFYKLVVSSCHQT